MTRLNLGCSNCLGPGSKNGKINYLLWLVKLEDIAALRSGLQEITIHSVNSYRQYLETIDRLNSRYFEVINSRGVDVRQRLRILIDDCRNLGTLPFAHLARCAFIAITFLREAVEFNIISEEACNEFLSQIRTVSHDLTSDASHFQRVFRESFVQNMDI